jgi:hypothetical protein
MVFGEKGRSDFGEHLRSLLGEHDTEPSKPYRWAFFRSEDQFGRDRRYWVFDELGGDHIDIITSGQIIFDTPFGLPVGVTEQRHPLCLWDKTGEPTTSELFGLVQVADDSFGRTRYLAFKPYDPNFPGLADVERNQISVVSAIRYYYPLRTFEAQDTYQFTWQFNQTGIPDIIVGHEARNFVPQPWEPSRREQPLDARNALAVDLVDMRDVVNCADGDTTLFHHDADASALLVTNAVGDLDTPEQGAICNYRCMANGLWTPKVATYPTTTEQHDTYSLDPRVVSGQQRRTGWFASAWEGVYSEVGNVGKMSYQFNPPGYNWPRSGYQDWPQTPDIFNPPPGLPSGYRGGQKIDYNNLNGFSGDGTLQGAGGYNIPAPLDSFVPGQWYAKSRSSGLDLGTNRGVKGLQGTWLQDFPLLQQNGSGEADALATGGYLVDDPAFSNNFVTWFTWTHTYRWSPFYLTDPALENDPDIQTHIATPNNAALAGTGYENKMAPSPDGATVSLFGISAEVVELAWANYLLPPRAEGAYYDLAGNIQPRSTLPSSQGDLTPNFSFVFPTPRAQDPRSQDQRPPNMPPYPPYDQLPDFGYFQFSNIRKATPRKRIWNNEIYFSEEVRFSGGFYMRSEVKKVMGDVGVETTIPTAPVETKMQIIIVGEFGSTITYDVSQMGLTPTNIYL